ncbi:popy class I histocompatibility antigen, alpha chain E-like [Synchiropus picturatus]
MHEVEEDVSSSAADGRVPPSAAALQLPQPVNVDGSVKLPEFRLSDPAPWFEHEESFRMSQGLGDGTAVDRMDDMLTLLGKRRSRRSVAAVGAGDREELLFVKDSPRSERRFLVDSGSQKSLIPPTDLDLSGRGCEKRTLKYIYTALSLPSKTQIPEFTAMGLLDHMQLDYFDNRNMTKLPRKPWMLRELGQEYFDKGTQSRRNKMQWFKVNLDILMKRMHQNNTDLHVLQWEHGCEADLQPDGTVHFMRGIDRYSYDGHNFLDYDALNDVWVSTLDAAKLTKDKWNQVKELISYTDGYLKTECMSWLKKFSDFEAKEPRTDKPELYIFSKKSVFARNHVLTCLATGLPSKNVHLEMRRNNRVLDQTDGLNTLQLSPNHDETFQQRSYVELLRSDNASFSCHVPKLNLHKTWCEMPLMTWSS